MRPCHWSIMHNRFNWYYRRWSSLRNRRSRSRSRSRRSRSRIHFSWASFWACPWSSCWTSSWTGSAISWSLPTPLAHSDSLVGSMMTLKSLRSLTYFLRVTLGGRPVLSSLMCGGGGRKWRLRGGGQRCSVPAPMACGATWLVPTVHGVMWPTPSPSLHHSHSTLLEKS